VKTTTITTLFISVAMAISLQAQPKHEHHAQTQIVKHGELQFAFDLISKEQHDRMVEMMGIDAKHDPDADHFINLTIMKKPSNELIKNAKVHFTITDPAGKKTHKEAHTMQGKKMFHYGTGFKMSGTGTYTVNAKVTIDGAKHDHTVKFQL